MTADEMTSVGPAAPGAATTPRPRRDRDETADVALLLRLGPR